MVQGRHRGVEAQRWGFRLVGAAAVLVVGWMTYEGMTAPPSKNRPVAEDPLTPPADASALDVVADDDAGTEDASEDSEDAGLALSSDEAPTLPPGAPRHVKIGVVLVTFAGAEGAPSNARSKSDALALAERLAEEAQSDFPRAVTRGDSGSANDIGRLPRGVLDPRTEVAVFGLEKGHVSGVLETPRGYWIVKRID